MKSVNRIGRRFALLLLAYASIEGADSERLRLSEGPVYATVGDDEGCIGGEGVGGVGLLIRSGVILGLLGSV